MLDINLLKGNDRKVKSMQYQKYKGSEVDFVLNGNLLLRLSNKL